MINVIVGYGYCGYYLAKNLLTLKQQVLAICRSSKEMYALDDLNLIPCDVSRTISIPEKIDTLYYLIPPPSHGVDDTLLSAFLNNNHFHAKRIVYFGSSGVYGNHLAQEVTENSVCHIKTDRQKRRLSAENLWKQWARLHKSNCAILRIAGIYGPNRIPIKAANQQSAIIATKKAPLVNHIFVKDLASIALQVAKCVEGIEVINVADGQPCPMGAMQQLLASKLGLKMAPEISFDEAYQNASSMKKEFMRSSKKICINKLKTLLNTHLKLTPLDQGLNESISS